MGRIISAAATGLVLQFSAVFGGAPSAFAQSTVTAQNTTNTGATLWVTTTQRIKSKIYENARLSPHPIVVVVVHGETNLNAFASRNVSVEQAIEQCGWIDRGLRLLKSLWPWLLLAAPLAGYFLIRKRSHPLGLWMKCWSAWRWLRRFWPFARAIFDAEQ